MIARGIKLNLDEQGVELIKATVNVANDNQAAMGGGGSDQGGESGESGEVGVRGEGSMVIGGELVAGSGEGGEEEGEEDSEGADSEAELEDGSRRE